MFVIEKYGYLTESERENITKELKEKGFKEEKIKIEAPDTIKNYGQLIEFNIYYTLDQTLPTYINNMFGVKKEAINIIVKKNSFSKR